MAVLFKKLKTYDEWLMAIRISAVFLIVGALWILFSDRLVLLMFDDPTIHAKLQLWKGWFFVFVVAVLLLFMIKGYLAQAKQLSKSLNESEERFSHIIEQSVSGICITNNNGILEYVNQAFCEITGYSSNELTGHSVSILLGEEKQLAPTELHKKLLENRIERESIWDITNKNGTPLKVFADSFPITWVNGEKRLVIFVNDVTRQQHAEEDLKRSEKRYKAMMEALHVPLFIVDVNGIIEYANQSFVNHFGESEGNYCFEKIMDETEKCSWCVEIEDLAAEKKCEYEFQSKIDDRIYHIVMVPIEYDYGKIRKMVVMKDMTDIINAKHRAEESDRLKTAFLANISHEVRTPLNAILGFSSVLNDETLPADERARFIDLIHHSGMQLLNIIDDIVDVASIENGNISVSILPINVHSLLKEVLDVMKLQLADRSKPELTLEIQNHLPNNYQVNADPLRLKQVLMNLMANGIKFTRKGSVVLYCNKDDKGFVVFQVKDTGVGIPSDKLNIIFDSFRQVDESSTRIEGGNGLGLFISKNLVNKMGGSIYVQSDFGKGSVFSVKIPCATDS
jgi:PAS domain S-box-containing protein